MSQFKLSLLAAIAVLFPTALPAAVITVNTTQDVVAPNDNLCSLREALTAADTNAASGAVAGECVAGSAAPLSDRINFSVNGRIAVSGALGQLPQLTDGELLINGWSAPGAGPGLRPTVAIDGNAVQGIHCLWIFSDKNKVRGLAIGQCYNAIRIEGASASENWIYGNSLGTNPNSGASIPNENGVSIDAGASGNLIGTNGDGTRDQAERNVISGNIQAGVGITGLGTVGNVVAGNSIGVTWGGTQAQVPNQRFGVQIGLNAADNRIGTDGGGDPYDLHESNVISGNTIDGVRVDFGAANVIAGNHIGTDITGMVAIANFIGVSAMEGSTDTRIGTDGDGLSDTAERNVISGNTFYGVIGAGDTVTVAGNYVGVASDGVTQLANGSSGIVSQSGALGTGGNAWIIGGATQVFRNVIAGNGGAGISVGSPDVRIECNYVGADANGAALSNGMLGMNLSTAQNTAVVSNLILSHASGGVAGGSIVEFVQNHLEGNTPGLSWSGVNPLTAIDNWWGDASGPTHVNNPGGIGDEVSESPGSIVNYTPWLNTAPILCP